MGSVAGSSSTMFASSMRKIEASSSSFDMYIIKGLWMEFFIGYDFKPFLVHVCSLCGVMVADASSASLFPQRKRMKQALIYLYDGLRLDMKMLLLVYFFNCVTYFSNVGGAYNVWNYHWLVVIIQEIQEDKNMMLTEWQKITKINFCLFETGTCQSQSRGTMWPTLYCISRWFSKMIFTS